MSEIFIKEWMFFLVTAVQAGAVHLVIRLNLPASEKTHFDNIKAALSCFILYLVFFIGGKV